MAQASYFELSWIQTINVWDFPETSVGIDVFNNPLSSHSSLSFFAPDFDDSGSLCVHAVIVHGSSVHAVMWFGVQTASSASAVDNFLVEYNIIDEIRVEEIFKPLHSHWKTYWHMSTSKPWPRSRVMQTSAHARMLLLRWRSLGGIFNK